MNDWQPIETAPKDGTRFIAYGKGSEGLLIREEDMKPMVHVAYWFVCEYDGYEYVADGLYRKKKMATDGAWMLAPLALCSFKPTHWMPFPEPPTTAQ